MSFGLTSQCSVATPVSVLRGCSYHCSNEPAMQCWVLTQKYVLNLLNSLSDPRCSLSKNVFAHLFLLIKICCTYINLSVLSAHILFLYQILHEIFPNLGHEMIHGCKAELVSRDIYLGLLATLSVCHLAPVRVNNLLPWSRGCFTEKQNTDQNFPVDFPSYLSTLVIAIWKSHLLWCPLPLPSSMYLK